MTKTGLLHTKYGGYRYEMAAHNALVITAPGHQRLRNSEEGEVCFNVHNVR